MIAAFAADSLSPNLLLSGLAGGIVGWSIWRICRTSWNAATVRWAVIFAVLMPLLAALLLLAVVFYYCLWVPGALNTLPLTAFGVRTLCAVLLSAFFAFVQVKRRR